MLKRNMLAYTKPKRARVASICALYVSKKEQIPVAEHCLRSNVIALYNTRAARGLYPKLQQDKTQRYN